MQEISEQGMPKYRNPTERGKLFVEYSIIFPMSKSFTSEEQQTISKLFATSQSKAKDFKRDDL